jgi:hypothetical protein
MSYAASGMILQNHRRVPLSVIMVKIAASEALKRVTGGISRISKYNLSKQEVQN